MIGQLGKRAAFSIEGIDLLQLACGFSQKGNCFIVG